MRIHIIIDPKGKVDSRMPDDLCKRDNIRVLVADLNDGFTIPEYDTKIRKLLDQMMEVPIA